MYVYCRHRSLFLTCFQIGFADIITNRVAHGEFERQQQQYDDYTTVNSISSVYSRRTHTQTPEEEA